ncbi:MAG TPA: AIR synthase related protein, partial [Sediminibacterium sp.]|nr:AIR synthase related protein [Sediminibacterium sp.]
KDAAVEAVFKKWDLSCSKIGEVTDDGLLQFYMHGELEAAIPAESLVLGGGAPQYTRAYTEPTYLSKIKAFAITQVPDITELKPIAAFLNTLPNIASKRWVYTQYDSMVGAANASTNAPSDAAIVLAKGTGKALAITVDCNSKYVFADPYTGAMIAVAEASRNIVCSGGEPIGVTNCLNFGNPYDPEVYYQFVKAVTGMGDACRKFNTPVTGGNVSFYNQNPEGPVYPTPTIGMVGILDQLADRMTLHFKQPGDKILLLGKTAEDIGSSEYLHKYHQQEYSNTPYFNLDEEYQLQQLVLTLIRLKLVQSAHDISEGGLAITLLESCYPGNLGCAVHPPVSMRLDAFWFGEAQGRVVVSCTEEQYTGLLSQAQAFGVPVLDLGSVTPGQVSVGGEDWGQIGDWKQAYDSAIEQLLSAELN